MQIVLNSFFMCFGYDGYIWASPYYNPTSLYYVKMNVELSFSTLNYSREEDRKNEVVKKLCWSYLAYIIFKEKKFNFFSI